MKIHPAMPTYTAKRPTRSLSILCLLLFFLAGTSFLRLAAKTTTEPAQKWVGTWATAIQLVEPQNRPPEPGLTSNSLRQVVRVSIGGEQIRLKFSNQYSRGPVTMKSVQIAASTGGSGIDPATNQKLTFNGLDSVTMAAGTVLYSDPLKFHLNPRMEVAITLYFEQTDRAVTGHPGSRTTSYLLAGNSPAVTDFTGAVTTDHWYVINAIEVMASSKAACVAIIGNSITDGRGSTTNAQNRWPDIFAERLLSNDSTKQVGVLNMGIGGNCVLAGGLGPTAVSRYERDVLNQAGVRWAVVFEGVNDIGGLRDNSRQGAETLANRLIDAYKQMISLAHGQNIRIYGGTIMPFKNNGYYTPYREVCRNLVNDWIRTSRAFDGVIDFDRTMRNPSDTTTLQVDYLYENDYLHPNAAGHARMGESVDLNLFK